METIAINKIGINALKNDIKKLSEEQRFLRNQRKTVNIKGERTMEPWVAAMKHRANREKLRIMFAAYGLMRGKSLEQIETNHSSEENSLKSFLPQISKIIETYSKIENELQK
jgi:hypothetical protein